MELQLFSQETVYTITNIRNVTFINGTLCITWIDSDGIVQQTKYTEKSMNSSMILIH